MGLSLKHTKPGRFQVKSGDICIGARTISINNCFSNIHLERQPRPDDRHEKQTIILARRRCCRSRHSANIKALISHPRRARSAVEGPVRPVRSDLMSCMQCTSQKQKSCSRAPSSLALRKGPGTSPEMHFIECSFFFPPDLFGSTRKNAKFFQWSN